VRAAVLTAVVLLVAVAASGAAVAALFVSDPPALLHCALPSAPTREIGDTTFVDDASGQPLGAVPSSRNREPVPLATMSPWLAKATVAVEDRRFWTRETAIDAVAITRAAVANYRAGKTVQGGSTLTQQLARDLYLPAPAPTLSRKLKEACLAAQIEQRDSKRTIISDYLNDVYYGQNAYGVQAAAETYFSKPASKLTVAQAALLAGLPQAPTVYDPMENAALARHRRNEVLNALLASKEISPARYRIASRSPLGLHPGTRYAGASGQPFFEYGVRELEQRFGRKRSEHGGLQVDTTLDTRLQRLATKAIGNWLGRPGDPAAAVVAMTPGTGAIRAMAVNAPGHSGMAFNLASQSRRQAGSTFKLFTLTAAMQEGIPLNSVWNGPPSLTIPDPICMNADGPWDVHNFADEESGTMSLLQATANSVNTIYAQIVTKVGPEKIVDVAREMGVQSPLVPVCSITLGPEGVSPLDMTDAFATVAAGGIHHTPEAIQRVNGAPLTSPPGKRVLSKDVVSKVTYALSGVIKGGTGTAAALDRPAAGKTGTAESFEDAWFCGFVPQLATCVWVGYPQAETPLENLDGFGQVTGGSIPARIWHDFMAPALHGVPVKPLPAPPASALKAAGVLPAPTPTPSPLLPSQPTLTAH
jgi:penicillin-binding protein 1A